MEPKKQKLVRLFDDPKIPEVMVPEWVVNLHNQFAKALEKRLNIHPETGDAAEIHGKIVGLFEGLISNPAPAVSPEKQQELHPLSKVLLETYQQILQQFPTVISETQIEATKEPYEEKKKFFQGYASVSELVVTDHKGIPQWSTDAVPIYSLMLAYWPVINRMSSVTELHDFLCKSFPGQQIERKRIEGICRLIGLKFCKPGRPRKAKKS